MVLGERSTIFKTIIIVGLLVTTIGFAFHFATPSTTRSGFAFFAEPNEVTVEHIYLELGEVENFFGIEVRGLGQMETPVYSGYILNNTEYDRYSTGTPIEEVSALLTFGNGSTDILEMTVEGDVDLYIVVVNLTNQRI